MNGVYTTEYAFNVSDYAVPFTCINDTFSPSSDPSNYSYTGLNSSLDFWLCP